MLIPVLYLGYEARFVGPGEVYLSYGGPAFLGRHYLRAFEDEAGGVLDADALRLPTHRVFDRLKGHRSGVADPDAAVFAFNVELDGDELGSQDVREGGHDNFKRYTSRLAGGDLQQSIPLLLVRPVIEEKSNSPVALMYRPRPVGHEGKAQTI